MRIPTPPGLCLALLTAAWTASACAVVETDLSAMDAGVTPDVPTSLEDGLATILKDTGSTCDEGTVPLTFAEAGEVHAVTLVLEAGDLLDLSIEGDDPLHTRLAVHGPADEEGDYGELPRVVSADDGPLHAEIEGYAVPQTGYWLVVVTTWAGGSLGSVTLEIAVDGADPSCDTEEACCLLEPEEGADSPLDEMTTADCATAGGVSLDLSFCELDDEEDEDDEDDTFDDDSLDEDVCCVADAGTWFVPEDACDALGGHVDESEDACLDEMGDEDDSGDHDDDTPRRDE